MEDTLRARNNYNFINNKTCLNPCFNGRYSQSEKDDQRKNKLISLNPCFNGRYSQSGS